MPPTLITLQPCKDILQDPQDGATSMIGVITRIEAFAVRKPEVNPTGEELPSYLFEPFKIVALWKKEDDETPLEFQLKLTAEAPDGKRTDWSEGETVTMKTMYFATFHYLPPLGARVLGVLKILVSVRDLPTEQWTEAGRFPLLLEAPNSAIGHQNIGANDA